MVCGRFRRFRVTMASVLVNRFFVCVRGTMKGKLISDLHELSWVNVTARAEISETLVGLA